MKDPYEHIHMATNERLAEILEDKMQNGRNTMRMNALEYMEAIMEAAARLRTKHKTPFNHEQFE